MLRYANPFNIQCRVCTAFAHDGICKHCLALTHMLMWQETIGGTSGTLSATSGSWLCDCRWERERALQLKLLRRLCPSPSPNLLMPGVTAQLRSRTWQLQFWLARHGETDAVSVPLFLLFNCVMYITILLFYCYHIPLYRAISRI